MRENQNKMARFTKALLIVRMSRKRQRRRGLRRRMMTLVVLKRGFLAQVCLLICLLFQSLDGEGIQRHRSCHPRLNRFHKPAHKLVRCYRNSPRPKIHFTEPDSFSDVKAKRHAKPGYVSASSTPWTNIETNSTRGGTV